MKRICSFALALLLVFSFAVAEAESATTPSIDISTLSIEQLQALRAQIDQRLVDLGAFYIDIDKTSQGASVISLQERLVELGLPYRPSIR